MNALKPGMYVLSSQGNFIGVVVKTPGGLEVKCKGVSFGEVFYANINHVWTPTTDLRLICKAINNGITNEVVCEKP